MPLDRRVEGGHGEGQTRLKIGPAPPWCDRLIPLFAVGAFLAFTLSQAEMIMHWQRPGTGQACRNIVEFISIKSWAATRDRRTRHDGEHSRCPSPDRGRLPSIGGFGL